MPYEDRELIDRDKRSMRRLFYVFLFGILPIWCGLLTHSKGQQMMGVLLCLGGFGWLALGGWRVMLRCAKRHDEGT